MTPEAEFWHELVIAGVGGRSVEEAKATLTLAEARAWRAYFETRGTGNLGLRLEYLLAQLCKQILAGRAGRTVELAALQPHLQGPGPGEVSIDDYAAGLGVAVRVRDGG